MANPKTEHLFEQAYRLAAGSTTGRPRQVDLRRAISSAYYGLFHFVLASLADEFVGINQRASNRYALVYRSVDHRTLKDLCIEAKKRNPSGRYLRYLPPGGFGAEIQEFSVFAVELQERRHSADYDPLARFRRSDVTLSIDTARDAIRLLASASTQRRKTFLTLLLCPPR
jgi:hypothetical protein